MSFGQRLSIVRKQRNMTQKDIGVQINMVPDLVSKYERDAIVPSIETAAKFAKALDISLDYLVFGHEPRSPARRRGLLKSSSYWNLYRMKTAATSWRCSMLLSRSSG